MTTIYLYAGCNDKTANGDILLASASMLDNGRIRDWSIDAALTEARSLIKRRGITDVVIESRGSIIWGDSAATERLYPETGKPPAPVRSDMGPGAVIARSAVRCPWDSKRYKIIQFA